MLVEEIIKKSIELKKEIDPKEVEHISKIVTECYSNGKKILICGNGGSAGDAQHFAGELIGMFRKIRKALPCIALTTDTSVITSLSNDFGFETVFKRQVEAHGQKGDILIGISTSGNSENIIQAFQYAKEQGIITFALLGSGGGKIKPLADYNISLSSKDTPRVQESHILILHIIAEIVEKELFPE